MKVSMNLFIETKDKYLKYLCFCPSVLLKLRDLFIIKLLKKKKNS